MTLIEISTSFQKSTLYISFVMQLAKYGQYMRGFPQVFRSMQVMRRHLISFSYVEYFTQMARRPFVQAQATWEWQYVSKARSLQTIDFVSMAYCRTMKAGSEKKTGSDSRGSRASTRFFGIPSIPPLHCFRRLWITTPCQLFPYMYRPTSILVPLRRPSKVPSQAQ